MSAVENMLNTEGLFNGVFTILNRVVPTAFNVAGNMVSGLFDGAKTFVELVTENGPLAAMNTALNSLFTRETVESVIADGGLDNILSQPPVWVTLSDGRIAQQIALSDSAAIFLDETGEIASIMEGGITSTGSFVWTTNNHFTMESGAVDGGLETGYSMHADVEGGRTWNIMAADENGSEVMNIRPEQPNGRIGISSIFNSITSEFNFALTNVLLCFANSYMARINSDMVESITQKVNAISAGSLFSNTNKFLYALANGISNPSYLITTPQYILNQGEDIIDHSNATIDINDIFPIVLYKGMTANLPLNGLFDAARWLVESQIKYRGELVLKAQADLAAYFVSHPGEWNRPVAAVGYSGGFMPLVEAVSESLYNVKTLMGLGAPTAYLPGIIPVALLQLIDAVAANNLLAASTVLLGMGWGYGAITGIDQVKNIIISKIRQMVQSSNMTGETPPFILSPKTELVVNVWGTEDVFYKEFGVTGPRENFLGKNTYNIEIVGADHFDYIRGINGSDTWNNTVASFVTDLTIASEDENRLSSFINQKIIEGYILPEDARDVYVVRLSGCDI